MKNQIDSYFAISIIALVAAVVGFAFWISNFNSEELFNSSNGGQYSSQSAIGGDDGDVMEWETYTNSKYNFSAEVPVGWEMQESEGGEVVSFAKFSDNYDELWDVPISDLGPIRINFGMADFDDFLGQASFLASEEIYVDEVLYNYGPIDHTAVLATSVDLNPGVTLYRAESSEKASHPEFAFHGLPEYMAVFEKFLVSILLDDVRIIQEDVEVLAGEDVIAYTDDQLGFELMHPASWSAQEDSDGVTIYQPRARDDPPGHTLLQGMFIYIYREGDRNLNFLRNGEHFLVTGGEYIKDITRRKKRSDGFYEISYVKSGSFDEMYTMIYGDDRVIIVMIDAEYSAARLALNSLWFR